jgi:hypothetical protein
MTLRERIEAGIKNIKAEDNATAFRHIKHTLTTGRTRELDDSEESLWAFVMRMHPRGSSGHIVKTGLTVFLAAGGPFNEGTDNYVVADALYSVAHAMRMEIKVRYKEDPRNGGLVYAACILAEVVRNEGLDVPLMIRALRLNLAERHPDPGTRALIQFLEGFSA